MRERLAKYLTQYLDSKVIFALDLFLSVLSSAVVLFLLIFFASSDYYSGLFACWWMLGSAFFSCLGIFLTRNYKLIVRHSTLRDLRTVLFAMLIKEVLLAVLLAVVAICNGTVLFAIAFDLLLSLFFILCARLLMLLVYDAYKAKVKDVTGRRRMLVYGTSDKSFAAIARFKDSGHYRIVGFISDKPEDQGLTLSEYNVYSCQNIEEFRRLVDDLSLGAVLFTRESDVKAQEQGLVSYCAQEGVKTLIVPSVDEVIGGRVMKGKMREIRIEDLLGRPEIKLSMDEIERNFKDKTVLVTGAAGSIGSELCRQLASFGVKKLILYDNAETPMYNLRLELEARFPGLDFVPVIGSVTHSERLDFAFSHFWPDVVFHAAAYKHVPLMEENPCEAVLTNVNGTRNVADKCVEFGVGMMVMISTDKAVNPTNIMGCSKRLAEIYVQSLGVALSKKEVNGRTKFVTTRFGNVLGSNGSVIPHFRDQIEHGGPVTVTHPEITRFFMTIPEACRLVMEAATMSTGNQIYVFDMGESVKIADLAKRMIELAGFTPGEDIQIEYTGLRPGEKLYEEVLANTENTIPTTHDRIRIAKVREYDYAEAVRLVDDLTVLSRAVDIPDTVRLMKEAVPEFKSKNSRFEIYDK